MKPLEDYPNAPDLFFAYRDWLAAPGVERTQGGWNYQGRFYPDYLFVGGASFAIQREARRYCHGRGLDIGAGLWPLPGAEPIDIERGPGAGKTLDQIADGSQDFVFSSHCLEHIADWKPALASWLKKLRPKGIIFLYLPHPTCAIWHPGSPFVGDGHKWLPSPDIIKDELGRRCLEVCAADDGPDAMQSFYVCAIKPAAR